MGKMYVLSEKEQVVYVVRAVNHCLGDFEQIESKEWIHNTYDSLEECLKYANSLLMLNLNFGNGKDVLNTTITIRKMTMSLDVWENKIIATLGFQPSYENFVELKKELIALKNNKLKK